MENASKALVIAGAILVAILLISLGMLVLNKATGILDGEQLDQASASTFNQKFTRFEGTTVKGSDVRSLIGEINAYNGSDEIGVDGKVKIKVDSNFLTVDSDGMITGGTNQIINSKAYKVEMKEYTKGRVSKIEINED